MVFLTHIKKFNTIISGSKMNTGLNPISELRYGTGGVVTRALVYFDHSKVKELMDGGVMPDMSKMKHTLHITNAGSIDFTQMHDCDTSPLTLAKTVRATSFDLIFFLIPKPWDAGKGFEYVKSFLNADFYSKVLIDPDRLVSTDGSNWFQRMNGFPWEENGVYSNDTLSVEYDKFAAGEESIVIARQHFDVGNENINVDITDTFNKFLTGDLENNGIGIAFSPMYEISETEYENYLALLTQKTNTFFEPFVETRYEDAVNDDRSNFVLGKKNRLYLYCTIGDHLDNLDNNPSVTLRDGAGDVINDSDGNPLSDIVSTQQTKGIYYIDLKLSSKEFEPDTMLYDTWSNLSYNGDEIDDVELDFTLKQSPSYFNIGNSSDATNVTFTTTVSGIKEREQILRGDVRKLVIKAKPSYTTNTVQLVDDLDIRLYVRDGEREIDVIEWDKVNKAFSENFYLIDTGMLIPQRYYVDIRIKYGMNTITHHDVLLFDIVSSLNNKYA